MSRKACTIIASHMAEVSSLNAELRWGCCIWAKGVSDRERSRRP
ncbi:MAG TPA: hypothetical protein VG276_06915 [Actinomycetes bacterium]|nr:hypothetical protein [Actinomycetes bacterium]